MVEPEHIDEGVRVEKKEEEESFSKDPTVKCSRKLDPTKSAVTCTSRIHGKTKWQLNSRGSVKIYASYLFYFVICFILFIILSYQSFRYIITLF